MATRVCKLPGTPGYIVHLILSSPRTLWTLDIMCSFSQGATIYSTRHENGDISVPFCLNGICSMLFAVLFPFRTCKWPINTLGVSYWRQSKLVRLLTGIDTFTLPWSSKLCWDTVLLPLIDFERVLRSPLDWEQISLSTINWASIANWLRSPLNAADRLKYYPFWFYWILWVSCLS